MPVIDYTPPGSLAPLFMSTKFWNILIGPVGSAKTTACIFFLLARAASQKPGKNGIRRTRYVISRTTLPQLKMTVLRDILSHLGAVAVWRPSESMVLIDQPPIYSEWFLVPLETPQDQRRLLSLQLSGAWFNEGREIPFELITGAAGRIPRYPPATEEGVSHPFVLIDSNPGVIGSELYEFCMKPGVRDRLYIHQPSAMSPEADWKQFLAPGYYERLLESATKDWADVHVHGQWGRDLSGAAVHASTFDDGVHVATKPLEPRPGVPLLVSFDPGRQPAALLAQVDEYGTLRVFREFYAENLNFYNFYYETVRPVLMKYLGAPILATIDPAGVVRSTMSEDSPYTMLQRSGLDVVVASTNDIEPRVSAVDRLLATRGPHGRPMLLIDPVKCPVLLKALRGDYRYKRRSDGVTLDPKPEKRHPVSDVMDALQYLAMLVLGRGTAYIRERAERAAQRPIFGYSRNRHVEPGPETNLEGWV